MDILDFLTAHPAGYRWIAATLGFLSTFTHTFRLITYWDRLPSVMRVWGVLIGMFAIVCAFGSYIAIRHEAPPSELTLVLAALQLAVVVCALVFPWLVTRSKRPLPPLLARQA